MVKAKMMALIRGIWDAWRIPGIYMKHMGMKKGICRCCECKGADGSETKKKIRKSQKSRARQEAKENVMKALKEIEKL